MRLQLNSEKTGGLPHWTMAVNTPCPDITQTSYGSALLPVAAPVGENGDCPIRYFLASDFVSSLVGGDEKGGGEFGLSVSVLYASVVFTIGSFLRQMFRDRSTRIIYEEVPDTELLEDLINGVYIARIQGNLHVEYKLYHELIRIYRSPELLAHVTRGKKAKGRPELSDSCARDEKTTPSGQGPSGGWCPMCGTPAHAANSRFCHVCGTSLPSGAALSPSDKLQVPLTIGKAQPMQTPPLGKAQNVQTLKGAQQLLKPTPAKAKATFADP